MVMLLLGDDFDRVKGQIARYESDNGRYKIHVNADRTIDCGRWQINSRHFVERDVVGKSFDTIFVKFGVGTALHDRVAASIANDRLNEALARKIFELRGIKAWTSSRKFIKTKR